MAGHSKWANIKHRKSAQDAKRGKIFTKLIKEITIAARLGGGDEETNPRLRQAVEKAKTSNMPKETIDRAIKKGTGDLEGVSYEEGVLEGYGPGGVAIMVEFMTDNRTQTVADIRHSFNKHGGSLGVDGSVAFMFDRKGVIQIPADTDYDTLLETALEGGAEDVKEEEENYEIRTEPETFSDVCEALKARGIAWERAEVTQIPQTTVEVSGKQAEQTLKLLDKLEDNDDIQNVYSNFDIPEEEWAALTA